MEVDTPREAQRKPGWLIVTIDAEKAGKLASGAIPALGIVLADSTTGKVIEKPKKFYFKTTEERPNDDYWSKPAQIKQWIKFQSEGLPEAEQWQNIAEEKKRWAKLDPEYRLLSDCPTLDIENPSVFLEKYAKTTGFRYSDDGTYHSTIDLDSMFEALPARTVELVKSEVEAHGYRNTHEPEEDAMYVWQLYWRTKCRLQIMWAMLAPTMREMSFI